MKPENKDLREVFRAYADSKRSDDRRSCPPPEALAASFEAGAARRKKKRIVDHLSECPACREEFRLYLELQKAHAGSPARARREPAEREPKTRRLTALPSWRYAAIAAGACLILSAVILFLRDTKIPEAERAAATGIALVSPESSHDGSRELVFRWRAFSPSHHYIVELFDEALLPVWVSPPIKDVQARFPSGQAPPLKSGSVYFWMVTAYADGGKTGESRLARFTITK